MWVNEIRIKSINYFVEFKLIEFKSIYFNIKLNVQINILVIWTKHLFKDDVKGAKNVYSSGANWGQMNERIDRVKTDLPRIN